MFAIRNDKDSQVVYAGVTILAGESYTPTLSQQTTFTRDLVLISDLLFGYASLILNDVAIDGEKALSILSYVAKTQDVAVTSTPDPSAFAMPLYRTKMSSISAPVQCAAGASTVIDFVITAASIFATGGEIIVQNALFGDSIMAEIFDVNAVVPAPVREALCEDWPSVARYIPQAFVKIDASNTNGYFVLDTRPLAAQIPQGTSMRITYTAIASGVARNCVVNYFLHKKLPPGVLP